MKFIIDKQTITDLELFEKVKGEKSIFALFNYTKSFGGKKQLEFLFSNPLTDIDLLEQRLQVIQYFQKHEIGFDVEKHCFDFIEHYLTQQNVPNRFSRFKSFLKALNYKINPKNEYYVVQRGIRFLIAVLNDIYDYAKNEEPQDTPAYFQHCKYFILDKIDNTPLKAVLSLKNRRKLRPFEFGKLDFYFRKNQLNTVKDLLAIVYAYDAFKSIAIASDKHGFALPTFSTDSNYFVTRGLFHPFLESPVSNDFNFVLNRNVCFLTGPNMAGKSTFLKSLSISIYLAHLGFPVPASYLKTSLFNGLLTTINLSDNINKGYSHFYTEVLRVKYVAEQINQAHKIFVVFDELFRGTNVKDAYEASLSVVQAFSKLNNSVFAISTHIIEVADKLKNNDSLFFKYFEANMVDDTPQYNFKIKDGVTDERIGMYILKKEKVIETIERSI